jgi:hypothetical protein
MEIPTNKSEIIYKRGKSLKDMNSHGKTMRRHFVPNIKDENSYLIENRKRRFNKGDTKFTDNKRNDDSSYCDFIERCKMVFVLQKILAKKDTMSSIDYELYEHLKEREENVLENRKNEKEDKALNKIENIKEEDKHYDSVILDSRLKSLKDEICALLII